MDLMIKVKAYFLPRDVLPCFIAYSMLIMKGLTRVRYGYIYRKLKNGVVC